MIEDEDELSKKRRLAPASQHQLTAEKQAQDYLDKQLDHQQRDGQRPHRPEYAGLQTGRTQEAERRRLAEQEADRYLEARRQQGATDQSAKPQSQVHGQRDEQAQDHQHSRELAHQRQQMTQEERQRHDRFVQESSVDERAALQAARVIRREYETRQAPELGSIRTRLANEEIERDQRLTEDGRTQDDSQSRGLRDADAVSREQDRQLKDGLRQETQREQGSEAPAEKLQELKAVKSEVQRRQSWSDRYQTTPEERQEVEKSLSMQQSTGLTRSR